MSKTIHCRFNPQVVYKQTNTLSLLATITLYRLFMAVVPLHLPLHAPTHTTPFECTVFFINSELKHLCRPVICAAIFVFFFSYFFANFSIRTLQCDVSAFIYMQMEWNDIRNDMKTKRQQQNKTKKYLSSCCIHSMCDACVVCQTLISCAI